MIYYERVIFHSTETKKWIWGPLLDKTGLQNRTNKNHVTSKTAVKNCNRKQNNYTKEKEKKEYTSKNR